ncbi:uncharacterized protein LOC126145244 [Schistocerca cancellata]|uniref:uncharacterized protein LOC126145244 n=1 Tax=Schistocerca cancellata TaxID=274614 RepID=UPI002117DF2B|nr:uncharacterized protein LOC126145244 [Schistocerca cancellata]
MFEPRATCECSEAQMELIQALERRDLSAFRELLARPDVDPDHWYGRPYKGTCLMIACSEPGAEPFVVELIKAGASRHCYPRHSTASAPRPSTLSLHSHNGNYSHTERGFVSPDSPHRAFPYDTEHVFHQRLRNLSSEIDNVRYQNEKILQEQENLGSRQNLLRESVEKAITNTKEELQKNETHFDVFQQKLNEFADLLGKLEETEHQNNMLLNQILETLKKNIPE